MRLVSLIMFIYGNFYLIFDYPICICAPLHLNIKHDAYYRENMKVSLNICFDIRTQKAHIFLSLNNIKEIKGFMTRTIQSLE